MEIVTANGAMGHAQRAMSPSGRRRNGRWALPITLFAVQTRCALLIARCVVCLFAVTSSLLAADAVKEDFFKNGNAAYAAGKFADAIAAYQQAEKGGLNHWALHYNLGNAYYRAGEIGHAIASYERAFRLNSGNGDVIENLNLLSTKIGDPRVPVSGLAALFWRLFFWPGVNALAVIGSIAFWILAGGLAARFLSRPWLRMEFMVPLAGVIFIFGGWLAARAYVTQRPIAIVVTASAEVRSGPSLTYPANFTIPEGRRVQVLDEQEPVTGWLEIGVPQEGLKGWVPDSAVETL